VLTGIAAQGREALAATRRAWDEDIIELLCNNCAVCEILCEQVRLNRKDANPQGAAPSAKVLMFSQQLVAD
jgi:MinD superfamily P-loop ATPase